MKQSVLILTMILLVTPAYSEIELEGKEGLTLACRKYPENSEMFCACLVDSAVKELPRHPRQVLYLSWWISPPDFNFREPMASSDLPEAIDQMWGAWQRKAVPACNNITR